MKKTAAILFLLFTIFGLSSCDDTDQSGESCVDDSLNRTTSIVLGDVLQRCVNGKWYTIKECNDTSDCPSIADDEAGED